MTLGQVASECDPWREILLLGERLESLHHDHDTQDAPTVDLIYSQHEVIREAAQRLLGCEAILWLTGEFIASVLQPGDDTAALTSRLGFGARPVPALVQSCLDTRQTRWGDAQPEELPVGEPSGQEEDGPPKIVAIPLIEQENQSGAALSLGVLQLDRSGGQPFEADEFRLAEALAAQVATAFRTNRRLAQEHWRVKQLGLVRVVSAQIADLRDLDELAKQVSRLIQQTFNYYFVAIFTLEPSQEVLHFRASAGPNHPTREISEDADSAGVKPEAESPEAGSPEAGSPEAGIQDAAGSSAVSPEAQSPVLHVRIGDGIVGSVAAGGEEILARDVSREDRYAFLESLPETRAEIALPLKIEDRLVGVLDVQSDRANAFDETDLLVLRALAHNIAAAIEGARLYRALSSRAEYLSTISEVSRAITSILDLDELVEKVVELIYERFGFEYVHLFTVHTGRQKVFFMAGSGARSAALKEMRFAYDLDDPQGIIAWVARNGETVLANDVQTEPRYRPSALPPDVTRAELTLPLTFGKEVLGVLDIQSEQFNAFTEEHRFLFEALGDNIAIAMRNASLYRSERWRRQVADSLREVAGLISADNDLDQVLEAVLTELERTLPCDVAAVWLLDEDDSEPEETVETGLPVLRLAAIHGAEVDALSLEIGQTVGEIVESYGYPETPVEPPNQAGWLVEAVAAEEPVIRKVQKSVEPLGVALGFFSDYSAIAAPLRVGRQNLGVLSLAHQDLGRYGTEARAMTAAFASQAAVAIENARLFSAAHEEAWVATVLLQVGEATQSMTNLNELLATVVRITPMLVGIRSCAIYILDENNVFIPATSEGLDHGQRAEFERWRFAPGDVPAFDQLLEQKTPVIVSGEVEDPRLAGILFSGLDPDLLFESDYLVLVPLVAHGDVLGAFLIDYSDNQSSNANLEKLFGERLAIIQGIAHQTATAVENIRLLKTQKEEAYVSVALLQVAQSVVSSNDIDEILASIVRITPILVGVKRSLLYLWDDERHDFFLAASYGLPRGTGERAFEPGEFPLLDRLRDCDSLLAVPVSLEEEAAPGPPESWSRLQPPDDEQANEILSAETSLLFAFPLSARGVFLGGLLVEEPEVEPPGATGAMGTFRRLREKRLEIITGISQQAALAIQNDRLQRELVERERLEREMQLARDIQRTFLPERLPELPGWGLSAYWRPARQVGGDFYDVIELPGGRLGLVIADVADKGMPAALFMTLVRTLMRATVHQSDSPGEVLQRVNDVLVPDAQQGMFVTLFYGVLYLETGKLVYANAGHNPPVLLRQADRGIQRLTRSGMALGIQAGIAVEDEATQMQPGDFLVLYTDGVTESFSPLGEMFGEPQLHAVVEKAGADSAGEMLEIIDETVLEFIDDAFPIDDLTLVVVHREMDESMSGEQGLEANREEITE